MMADICLEVGVWEKHETEDVTVLQKNITFINFTFSCVFFSFQIQQAEISHYRQAESAKFLIHFYSRRVILESSEGEKISRQLIIIYCCAKRTKKTLWSPTVTDVRTRQSEKLI